MAMAFSCFSNKFLLPLILLVFGTVCGTAKAFQCYYVNSTVDNTGPLYPLDTNGLSGRYTGYWSNTTGIEYGDVTFQLWFLTFNQRRGFFLSLVALRNPGKLWDLVKPVILWTANRSWSSNVADNATFVSSADGNLSLQDRSKVVWSSNTGGIGVTELCISNLGNLYLTNSTGNILWQSFDSPSDVFSTQVAFKPGNSLVSWASETNTSQGMYKLVMDRQGLVLLCNSEPYWNFAADQYANEDNLFAAICWQKNGHMTLDLHNDSSLLANEQGFLNSSSCQSSHPVKRSLLLDGTQNITYETFFKLTPVGDMVIYGWNSTKHFWYAMYSLSSQSGHCFLPGQCGPYRVCNTSDGLCTKLCIGTFEFREELQVCEPTRDELLDPCKQDYEVIEMSGVDYFSSNLSRHSVPGVAIKEDCELQCINNCSCTAAFYKLGSCFLTYDPVQSLKTGNYTGLFKVPRQARQAKKQGMVLRVALPVLVPTVVLLLVILACILWRNSSRGDDDPLDKEDEELELSLRDCMPRRFTYKQLDEVTKSFGICLGTGGFGSVYKGHLEDGVPVAVKKLAGSNQTTRDFYAEVASLARTNHVNLVKFLGFCAEGPRKRLLVYEFVPNNSLDKWIFHRGPGGPGENNEADSLSFQGQSGLSWDCKFRIAIGTAQGLTYLHEECAQRIIHLDLKPENVLVDAGFVPKIADFGLSKLMDREVTYLQMTTMRGTPGYLAPEYLQSGEITEKSDVFSFGVLLLEIITGCRNKYLSSNYLISSSFGGSGPRPDFTSVEVWNDVSLEAESIDKYQAAGMKRLGAVAYLCLQDDPELRPSMSMVLKMMEGFIELPEVPPLSSLHFFVGYRSKMKLSSLEASISSGKTSSTSKFGLSSSSRDETTSLLLKSSNL